MASHTPGPWVAQEEGDPEGAGGQYVRVYINARGGSIATVYPCVNPARAFRDDTLSDMPERVPGPIQRANARLIAEAPDLASKGAAAMAAFDDWIEDETWPGPSYEAFAAKMDDFRATLANALGEVQP